MLTMKWRSSILLLGFIGMTAAMAQLVEAPQVENFSPEGEARSVQQVAVRFSHDMVALGEADANTPVTLTCEGMPAPEVTTRWLDTRRWVAEFKIALPVGLRCEGRLVPGLRSLAGTDVAALTQAWRFTTGGPKVDWFEPSEGAKIKENQEFLLHASGATSPQMIAQHLRCVADAETYPVTVLSPEAARIAHQLAAGKRRIPAFSEADTFAVRCAQPLPINAKVRLNWGKGIASLQGVDSKQDQSVGNYTVRAPLLAEVRCTKLEAIDGCDPRYSVHIVFSDNLSLPSLKTVEIRDAAGVALPVKAESDWRLTDRGRLVTLEPSQVTPPPAEGSVFSVVLPAGLSDLDGRSVSNRDEFPKKVQFATLPSYVGFPQGTGVLPFKAGASALWPLAVRRTEKAVPVKLMRIGGESLEAGAGRDVLAVRAATSADILALWQSRKNWPKTYSTPLRPYPVATQQQRDWAIVGSKDVATSGSAMEFVPLALTEPGLYLAEAHSSAFIEQLRRAANAPDTASRPPEQRASLVLVTNLNISTRIAHDGRSLVWVTAFDSGQAVAGVSIDVLACDGSLLAQGETDIDGLLKISQPLSGAGRAGACVDSESYGTPHNRLAVVARKGNDLALLVDDSGAYLYYSHGRNHVSAPSIGHTILDRALFKVGDTVHMQHLVRKPVATGFETIPAGSGRVDVRFGDDIVSTLPLAWNAAGEASSQWLVPADAKLGEYQLAVTGPDGAVHHALFSVEEFRPPVFEGSLDGAAVWVKGQQNLPVNVKLAFMAGGAAGRAKVTLQGQYFSYSKPPAEGYSFSDARLPSQLPQPLQPVKAQLDVKGTSRLRIAPPVLDRPTTLQAELKFSDPNGEVQTMAKSFALWHADTKIGVRVSPRLDPAKGSGSAIVSGVILDIKDRPLVGRPVEIFVQTARRSASKGYQVESTGPEHSVCTASTDMTGHVECAATELPSVAEPDKGENGWLFSIKGRDSLGKVVNSNVFVHPFELSSRNAQLLELTTPQPVDARSPASIRVRAPFLPATLLLTVERDGVLDSAVHVLTQPVTTLALPLLPLHAPNVRIHARFVRGLSGLAEAKTGEEMPAVVQSASLAVQVAPTVFALDVKVQPDRSTLAPRTTAMVKVTAMQRQDGVPAAAARLTLIAVDEALLALKDNPSWNVLEHMMRDRGIQVHGAGLEARLSRSLVWGAQSAFIPNDERGRIGNAPPVAAVAYSGARPPLYLEASDTRLRSQFSTLAFWSTDAVLDARGEATVAIPFNDSLTRWRLVAVVLNGAQQFGTGESSVQTMQPVQIFSGLPPVVRSGDRLIQQVTLRNNGKAPVSLEVQARALPKFDGGRAVMPTITAQRRVRLVPGQAQAVAWALAVPHGVRALRWQISARTPDGKVADAIEVEQLTKPALPVTVRQAMLLQIDGTASVPVAWSSKAQPGPGGVAVSLKDSLVSASLIEVKNWMASYPYVCLEQQSSQAIVAGDEAGWDRLMGELPKYLDAQGLVRYFPESSLDGSEMLTAYLLDMSAARGWRIPDAQRHSMLAGLQRVVSGSLAGRDWLPTGSSAVARLLSLQATLAEQEALADMAVLPVRPDDLSSLPTVALTDWVRALLAQPAASRSDDELRRAATQLRSRYDVQGTRMNWRNEDGENWWWFMWSGDVAAAKTALVLQQWQAIDQSWKSDIPLVITGLIGRQMHGRWSTTTANAWATLALTRFAADFEKGPVTGSTRVSLASERQASRTLSWPKPPDELLKPGATRSDTLVMEHNGKGVPWAAVSIKAAVRLDQSINAGMQVEKSITAIEQKVKGQWSVGDVARVRLTMHSQADLTWVVVSDPVPSGATILGRGLGRESASAQAGEKTTGSTWPAYIERGADSYRSYYRWVPRGTWSTEYSVRINNAGEFQFPATRVEAMYAPEIFAETPNSTWTVRDETDRR